MGKKTRGQLLDEIEKICDGKPVPEITRWGCERLDEIDQLRTAFAEKEWEIEMLTEDVVRFSKEVGELKGQIKKLLRYDSDIEIARIKDALTLCVDAIRKAKEKAESSLEIVHDEECPECYNFSRKLVFEIPEILDKALKAAEPLVE